jgi:hypothetical protein
MQFYHSYDLLLGMHPGEVDRIMDGIAINKMKLISD